MSRDHRGWVALILAALGITATGLVLRLHTFLWRLWAVISLLWVGFWFVLMAFSKEEKIFGLAIAIVPPVLLLLVAGLLAWVIVGLFGDLHSTTPPATPTGEDGKNTIAQDPKS